GPGPAHRRPARDAGRRRAGVRRAARRRSAPPTPGARLRAVGRSARDPGRARRSSLQAAPGMLSGGAVPAISVIVPTFDRARLLPAVLDSVLAQRECPSFEVVVVDDASTDDTPAVLASRRDLQVVRLARNGGVARARQAGAERARGALLAFHDSDDLMLPGRLGILARFLEANPDAGAVFANGLVEAQGSPDVRPLVPVALARRLDGRSFGVREVVCERLPVFLQTALISRAAFDAAGGIDVTLARHADLELTCRLALTGRTVFLDVPVF